jgi:hypothetical protein
MSGSTSTRYPGELSRRAVRMVSEIRTDHEWESAAMTGLAELLGVAPRRPCVNGVGRPGSTPACGRE